MTTEQIKDTKYIQLQSLVAFMDQLGYSYDSYSSKFYDIYNPGKEVVRFNTAVELHNNPVLLIVNESHPFHTDRYTYIKAYHSRIVLKVKLQSDRHGNVKCQSNKVKFVFEDYYDLFMGDDS